MRIPAPGVALSVCLALGLALAARPGAAEAGPRGRPAPRRPARPKPVPGTIEDPSGHALDRLFQDLANAERGRADGRAAIVQLGDSHTASDAFTARVRERLQRRFGDAGRGYLLPGRPPKHYYQKDAAYGSEGPWEFEDGRRREALEPFGLAGLRFRARTPDAVTWVETCGGPRCVAGRRVGRFEIYYRVFAEGGRLAFRVDDGAWQELDTRPVAGGGAGVPGTGLRVVPVHDGAHRLTLRPVGDGPIELFGVALERDPPGAVVDSIGVVGARAAHLHAWDWAAVGVQLGMREPSLVVLWYGTNESEIPDLDLARLEGQLVELVDRIRAAAPGASVLILGPPDRAVRLRRDCDRLARRRPRRGRKPPRLPAGCTWRTPQLLLDINEAERRAALRSGAAFFDLLAAMGGPGRMDGWVRTDPPLGAPDRVHLTSAGYERAADLFLDALLPEYDRWRTQPARRHPVPTGPGLAPVPSPAPSPVPSPAPSIEP